MTRDTATPKRRSVHFVQPVTKLLDLTYCTLGMHILSRWIGNAVLGILYTYTLFDYEPTLDLPLPWVLSKLY